LASLSGKVSPLRWHGVLGRVFEVFMAELSASIPYGAKGRDLFSLECATL